MIERSVLLVRGTIFDDVQMPLPVVNSESGSNEHGPLKTIQGK